MDETTCMKLALDLAAKGEGLVEPNPMVGCVLARDGKIIGQGFHQKFGGPHAEVNAIQSCTDTHGSTAYVTLEPCCHIGKTGPCSQALIDSGISSVVVATLDPFEQVAGRGIIELQKAGIEVRVGLCERESLELLQPYVKRVKSKLPWTIAKWAMSIDGKIATRTGSSQWISNQRSRQLAHEIRGRVDAIVVGIGTVLADNPLLTARPPGPRIAERVVADSTAKTPINSKLVQTANEFPTTILVGPHASKANTDRLSESGCSIVKSESPNYQNRLEELLRHLYENGATNVLIEGGGKLLGQFNDAQLIDEIHCFIGPKLIGGDSAANPVGGNGVEVIEDCHSWRYVKSEMIEDDFFFVARKN